MKKILVISFLTLTLIACNSVEKNDKTEVINEETTNQENNTMEESTLYEFTYSTPSGEEKSMKEYQGSVVLVVNTATKCGLTPQFEGLEELHNELGSKGLKVLGFPCNQFGGQEPLTNEEMVETCKINHGVTFELAEKIEVNGENPHPLYAHLKSAIKIEGDNEIRWNFEKFLIDKSGKVVKRFTPQTTPEEMKAEILGLL